MSEATPLLGQASRDAYSAGEKVYSQGDDLASRWLVDARSLEAYPKITLWAARALYFLVMLAIFLALFGLCASFILKGQLASVVEMSEKKELPAPSLVICPKPGHRFATVDDVSVTMGSFPSGTSGTAMTKPLNVTLRSHLPDELNMCWAIIIRHTMRQHGAAFRQRRKDVINIKMSPRYLEHDVYPRNYAGPFYFGLSSSEYLAPQQWNVGVIGSSIYGDIELQSTVVGRSDFSDGETHDTYLFHTTGTEPTYVRPGRPVTSLQLEYRSMQVLTVISGKSGISFGAVLTFLILFAATLRARDLFDMIFPEKLSEPPELEPHPMLQYAFGRWFPCFKRRPEAEEEAEAASSDGGRRGQS
eukprot:TRINITY_DN23085_c0_g1_i1.p1 TRINITY_DN23085_c0_g1~~TRINITY_DN23085_c0_g1_i1.p1  ORF type:complete len:359 (+),score=39.96 TRINITY_DN23085_c0_g1_i1:118-1194(+)